LLLLFLVTRQRNMGGSTLDLGYASILPEKIQLIMSLYDLLLYCLFRFVRNTLFILCMFLYIKLTLPFMDIIGRKLLGII
jgi:hypothetical protein